MSSPAFIVGLPPTEVVPRLNAKPILQSNRSPTGYRRFAAKVDGQRRADDKAQASASAIPIG